MGPVQVNRFPGNRLVRAGLRAVATGFGVGRFPWAPGTAGTVLALPLWYWTGGSAWRQLALLAAVVLLAVPAAREEMAATGRKDPQTVVIDEVAGMLLAATGTPWAWRHVLALFLLFRAFDILKFGPVAWLDAREGPLYVVADDLAAGACAALVYRGLAWLTG